MDGVATTEELWTTFKDSLLAAVKKFIPDKTARPKTCQPWVTPSIRKLINRRDRTYRKMKKTGSEDLRTEVKNLRRTVQRQLRRSYWNYLNTVFTGEVSLLLGLVCHQTKQARTNDSGQTSNIRSHQTPALPPSRRMVT